MVEYNCDLCKYKTKNKTDYKKHCKTKKHKLLSQPLQKTSIKATKMPPRCHQDATKKIAKKSSISQTTVDRDKHGHRIVPNGFICPSCGDSFVRKDSLKRHTYRCFKTREKEKDIKAQLELKRYKDELLKKEEELVRKNRELKRALDERERALDDKEKALDDKDEQIHYYKQILDLTDSKKSHGMSAFNYINANYTDAEPLKALSYEEFADANEIQYINDDKSVSYEDKLAQDLIYSHRHKLLGKYIGQVIVSLYYKDDPKKQSLWNTDISRLKYVVRCDGERRNRWAADLNGDYTKDKLIEPVMKKVKHIMMTYRRKYCDDDEDEDNMSFNEYGQKMQDSLAVLEILNGIDNEKTQKEVLKYIAPYFNDKKSRIEDGKKKNSKKKKIYL